MTLLQKIAGLLIALSLQACVSGPKYTAMTEQTKQAVQTATAYNLIVQDEIRPDVNVSVGGAAVGGLIGAAIEASVNDSRATTARGGIQPLYDEIVDVDYRKIFTGALNPVLSKHFNMAELKDTADVVAMGEKEVKAQIKKLKQGEALFFVNSFYQFKQESRMLQASTRLFMFLQSDKPNTSKPNFYSAFVYQSPLVGEGAEQSMQLWAADNAKLFKSQMQTSAQEITKAIDYQMQSTLNEVCIRGGQVDVPNILGGIMKIKGNVFEETDTLSKLRSKDGDMYIVPKSSVKSAKVKTCVAGEKS